MLIPVKECGSGVNKDLLPSELAPGQWSDVSNMRPRNGFMVRRGGFTAVYATPTVTPYFLEAYIASARWMVNAGIARVFANDATVETEITKYTDGKVISSITRVGTTATLTTATAHGRTTGNSITVYGATPSQYNGTYSITVTGATTFTYVMASDPGASATIITATGYEYRVQSNFTNAIDDRWTGGSFNGLLVINSPTDGMYYWSGDTTVRLRRMPDWPAGQVCDAIFFYKNYIFALAPTINGVKNSQMIMWSQAAEAGALPGAWTAATTNDAGDSLLPAETGGPLIHGATFGDVAYAFDSDACYGAQFIGGNDVFRFYRLPGVDGVLARNCIVKIPMGLVYLSNGDVKFFDGTSAKSIAEGRIRDWLRSTITNNAQRCFVALNSAANEVWVCFPSTDDTACTKAAVWNWDSDAWGIVTLPSLTCATTGLLIDGLLNATIDGDSGTIDSDFTTIDQSELSAQQQTLVVGNASHIALADNGTTDFGVAITCLLERKGLTFGDEDAMKTISASRWNFDSSPDAVVSIYHGAAKLVDADPTYAAVTTYTHGTSNMVNRFSTTGRQLAVKMTYSGLAPISLRSYALDVSKAGRF